MVTKGKITSGLKFNVFYRGIKLTVSDVSSEWEARRRACIIFAARTGNIVQTLELATIKIT